MKHVFFIIVASLFFALCTYWYSYTPKKNIAPVHTLPYTLSKISDEEALFLAKKIPEQFNLMGGVEKLSLAIQKNIDFLQNTEDEIYCSSSLCFSRADLVKSLFRLKSLLGELEANPQLLVEHFTWYTYEHEFLLSAYYEPMVFGDYHESAKYRYPLYALPSDVKDEERYYSRKEIDRDKVLQGKQLELVWLDNALDAFFLHIQGSGKVIFPHGEEKYLIYAGNNGHSYGALGRILVEDALLDKESVSMQSIRSVLANHPKQAEYLEKNARYIFFRMAEHAPLGAMSKSLTPYASVAVDKSVVPLGSFIFMQSKIPEEGAKLSSPLHGLFMAQDTGSAIKKARLDLFVGSGEKAAYEAGHLNEKAAVFFLLAK